MELECNAVYIFFFLITSWMNENVICDQEQAITATFSMIWINSFVVYWLGFDAAILIYYMRIYIWRCSNAYPILSFHI